MAKFLDLTGLSQYTAKIKEWVNSTFVPKTRKINQKPLTTDITLTASDVAAIALSEKGVRHGHHLQSE